jgi:hypothetical protein
MDTPEYDPHRPRRVEDMVCADTWTRLSDTLNREDPPNIVLVGRPGIGKSCALRLALTGKISMWMRCSVDPTLRDNRERIKMTARGRSDTTRWIILEHADLLHADAQSFLRRIIETSVGSTRFVLEVRDLSAIAEPLLSRTTLFTVPTAMPYEIRAEIMNRAPSCDPVVAERIAVQSKGNIRWAVLQALGGGDGMISPALCDVTLKGVTTWSEVLHVMEDLQKSGSAPHMWLDVGSTTEWERPGGACPWALTAAALIGGVK